NHVQCPVAGFEMYNCVQMQGHLLHLHAALWQPSPGLRHNSVNRSSASLCDCLVHGERLWLEAGKGISLEANVGVHEYIIPSLHILLHAGDLNVQFDYGSRPRCRKPRVERPYWHRLDYVSSHHSQAYPGKCNPRPSKILPATRRVYYLPREV